jgi:signal-transduction protein with cAMP-binding, CBS, and nucleotidyltransferase domain
MLVSGFMVPYEKVLKCQPSSTVEDVLASMTDEHVSCLVITLADQPHGIVTKTDMCWCYRNRISLESQVGDIMPWTLSVKKIRNNLDRDGAAKFFEKNKVHHAIVVDENDNAVGLISAMDIAIEVAKDARAWPYIRHESGRVPPPQKR